MAGAIQGGGCLLQTIYPPRAGVRGYCLLCYCVTGTGSWCSVAQRVFFLNLLLGLKANWSVSVKLGAATRARVGHAWFFQGLWVTGKRPSGYLKRAALRIVPRKEEAPAFAQVLNLSAKTGQPCVRAALRPALEPDTGEGCHRHLCLCRRSDLLSQSPRMLAPHFRALPAVPGSHPGAGCTSLAAEAENGEFIVLLTLFLDGTAGIYLCRPDFYPLCQISPSAGLSAPEWDS